MMAYPTITMAYLDMWLERGENMQVIDLRNRESYMQGLNLSAECFPVWHHILQNGCRLKTG